MSVWWSDGLSCLSVWKCVNFYLMFIMKDKSIEDCKTDRPTNQIIDGHEWSWVVNIHIYGYIDDWLQSGPKSLFYQYPTSEPEWNLIHLPFFNALIFRENYSDGSDSSSSVEDEATAATAAATNASGAATGPPVAPISGFWLPCSDWWSLEPVQGSVRGMRFHGQMAGARERSIEGFDMINYFSSLSNSNVK